MYSVPVRCDGNNGIGELKGVLRFDGKQLSLQYQTADPIMHEFRTAPITLPIPAETIVSAHFKAGFLWLRPLIVLRFSDFEATAALPAAEAGVLNLRVRFADRVDARKVVAEVNSLCTEVRLARLDHSISEMSESLSRSRIAPTAASRQAPADGSHRLSDHE